MSKEMIRIFDARRRPIGIESREIVHEKGYWHETFHCWCIKEESGRNYLYFQIRSKEKKDYPGLLDITAAGHLLADETVEDGIREVQEELGLQIQYNDLHSIGVFKGIIHTKEIIDREFYHVFVYKLENDITSSMIQKDEVAGIVRADLIQLTNFVQGAQDELQVEGFEVADNGVEIMIKKRITKSDLVPHEDRYYNYIVNNILELFG